VRTATGQSFRKRHSVTRAPPPPRARRPRSRAVVDRNGPLHSLRLWQHARRLGVSQRKSGPFRGRYSGTAKITSCLASTPGHSDFSGTGKVSFLRRSTETVYLTEFCDSNPSFSGNAILTSSKDPKDQINMNLQGKSSWQDACGHRFSYEVAGGSGRFADATGSGHVTFQCFAQSSYTDRWSGMISL
jgi:hypothetical protein